ncbi:Urb2/Npa2 family-domain-containing protein [Gongronella butleri]|nr:Urb2/Npa2 family-domain-containing protein [Gongronella butleri]
MDAPAQDVERRVEFGFYVHSVKLLDKMQAADVDTYLATHAQLLQELLHWGIYAATRNDEIKQQQHACLELLVNALTQQLDAPEHQAHVLTALNSFMQMDMTLVEPQMPSIWPVLLNPAPNNNAHDAAFALAATVLELYAAARQMDAFIDELLSTLDHIKMDDGHQMLQKPLFSKRFLQLFATVATKHVPGPQMAMLFDRLAAALTKAHDAGQHTTTMLLVSAYTVHFVAALRLGFHQRQWFERSSVALFERLLQPSMTHVSDVATHALPALQVHFALANAFYDVYWLKLDTAARNALAATWTRLFQQATHENTPTSRLFLIHCANALFQHLYYSAFELGHGRALEGNMALVAPVLDFVLQDGWQQAQWDGQLESITTMEHTKLALWKLMLDEWFDTICGVIQDDQRAKKFIANILLTAGDNDNSMANGAMVSCRQLNLTLLRSANFYEAKCFHDHSVSVLLYGMVDLFKTPSSAEHDNLITSSIAKLDLSQPFAIAKDTIGPLADFLVASLSTPTMDAGMPASAIATLAAKLAHYVDVLLIFPVEYYRKAQRAHLLWILFLVDAWLLTFANATPATLRCSLSCRTFYLRFMNTIGSIGVLNANPTLLQWFVASVDQWRNSASLAAVSQDVDAWVNVTAEIDAKVLAAILSVAGGKNIDASTATYLQQTVAQRLASFETPETLTWTLNLLKSVNQFLPAILKKVQDDASIFGTYAGVQTLAAYLCDQIAHAETRLGANDTWSQADVGYLALCLRGVTLVQEYARCLKTQNKDLDVQRLSEASQSLMVPFVAWLPAQLAQNEHAAALEATGAFMSASTSTLLSQRQEASTLQLFELYWTVYTLVYTPNGQEMIMTTLARHVTDWIRALPHDQLLVLLNAFVQKTQNADEKATTPDQCRQHDVLLTMLTLLITSTSDGQKQALRPFLSTCITKLAAIVGNATRVHLVDNVLDVLHHISGDKAFEFQSFDVSTILSCLLQVLFPVTMDELTRELTFARANEQFKKVAVILANLARLHRDPLSDTVGAFVAMLDTMLQCFKSAPLSLVSSNNSNNSNMRSLAGNPVAKKKKRKTMAMAQGEQRANVYQSFAPLDVSCAERYARMISELTSKVTGDKRSDLVFHHVSKHAPFLLLQYFAIQADPVMNITIPAIKTALSFAYHDLLNLCNADDRMFVLVALNATGQEIFKAFYTTWKEQYKYAGQ